ncbi:MAG: hypothetical protein QXU32_00805 [Nitrososphaerales archaeon]
MDKLNYNILQEAIVISNLAELYKIKCVSFNNFIIYNINDESIYKDNIFTIYIDISALINNCVDLIMDGAFATFVGTRVYVNNDYVIDLADPDGIYKLSKRLNKTIRSQSQKFQKLEYH